MATVAPPPTRPRAERHGPSASLASTPTLATDLTGHWLDPAMPLRTHGPDASFRFSHEPCHERFWHLRTDSYADGRAGASHVRALQAALLSLWRSTLPRRCYRSPIWRRHMGSAVELAACVFDTRGKLVTVRRRSGWAAAVGGFSAETLNCFTDLAEFCGVSRLLQRCYGI